MDYSEEYWESKYAAGHAQRYPWDCIVTFVMRNAPKDRARGEVSIMEIGFGTASNLWFAAREGFQVAGIEFSAAGVKYAQDRFAKEGLSADLRVGSFTKLPWGDNSFDLVIDRGALTCVGDADAVQTLSELRRVLKPGGRAFLNPYSDSHSSYRTGKIAPTGETVDATGGTLAGTATVRFWSRRDVDQMIARAGWNILSLDRLEITDILGEKGGIHSEFRILAEKPR